MGRGAASIISYRGGQTLRSSVGETSAQWSCRQAADQGVLVGQQCTCALLSEGLPVPGLSSALCRHFLLASSQPSGDRPVGGWLGWRPHSRQKRGQMEGLVTGRKGAGILRTPHPLQSNTYGLMESQEGVSSSPSPGTEVRRSLVPPEQRESHRSGHGHLSSVPAIS